VTGLVPTALVLRALYLGDMVTGLPALAMLRTVLPAHRIVLAAPAGVGALAVSAGLADELTQALELQPLRAAPRHADVAVDLHGNGPPSRSLLEDTGARRVVAYSAGPHHWHVGEHEVARWCRLVSEAFGMAPPWPSLPGLLPVPPPLVCRRVPARVSVVHPGAKAAARRWPAERFADVASALVATGHRVVVTGGPSEAGLVAEVAARSGAEPWVGHPLPELQALVAAARVVVCGDTGVAHLASAYRTPSVTLFGPVPPALWGPPDDPRHQVLWHGVGAAGDPHGSRVDPALLRIRVDEVLDAAALAVAAA